MIDIIAHHGVKALIGEVQTTGVPVLKAAAVGHALAFGVLLAEDLIVMVHGRPIVDAHHPGLGPGKRRPDGQRPGAAAHVQQGALSVVVQLGEDFLVDALHHAAAPKGILPPNPGNPEKQRQQQDGGGREQYPRHSQTEHGERQCRQQYGQRQQAAYHIEHGG